MYLGGPGFGVMMLSCKSPVASQWYSTGNTNPFFLKALHVFKVSSPVFLFFFNWLNVLIALVC